jgi:hypothetical protein
MGDLLNQYKGDLSNFNCIKAELENVLEELDRVNRTKVTSEFAEDVLKDIKSIRLSIISITD